jgi:hypothetical protein
VRLETPPTVGAACGMASPSRAAPQSCAAAPPHCLSASLRRTARARIIDSGM